MSKLNLLFLAVILLVINACKKGDLPEEHYFGKVEVAQAQAEGAPDIEIRLDNKVLGKVSQSTFKSFVIPAGTVGKLGIYKAGSDTLLADSTVRVEKNSSQKFRFIYSPALGMQGFLSDVKLAPDTSRMQIFYNAKKDFNPDVVDIYVYTATGRSLEFKEAGVIPGIKKGQLSPVILTMPVRNPAGVGFIYYFKLKDVKTGRFLLQPANGPVLKEAYSLANIGGSVSYQGKFMIATIDDLTGNTEATNKMKSSITVL